MTQNNNTPSYRRSFIGIVATGISALTVGCLEDDDTNDSPSTNEPSSNETDESSKTDDPDPPDPTPQPEIEIEFRYFDSTRLMNIYHEAGDDITIENTGRLEITGDVDTTRLTVNSESDAPYQPGQRLFNDIQMFDGDSITVTWFGNDDDRNEVINEFIV